MEKEGSYMATGKRTGVTLNGLMDGALCANMQTANYMTNCCMEEGVICDVVTGINDVIKLVMYHEVKEVPCNGMYANNVNPAYVENFLMSYCSTKREHFDRLQKELIPMDVIKLIINKGAPRDCRQELMNVIMQSTWDKLDKELVTKVGDQEDFPQMLTAQVRRD